jgi:hypothetical protein
LPDLPPLDEVVLSARILGEQLINALGRDFDPQSASSVEAFPGEPLAHVKLAMLRSDVLQVLRGLTEVSRLAAGDAADRVMFQDRPGPEPRVQTLTPSGAAGSPPARESDDAPQAVRAGANVIEYKSGEVGMWAPTICHECGDTFDGRDIVAHLDGHYFGT